MISIRRRISPDGCISRGNGPSWGGLQGAAAVPGPRPEAPRGGLEPGQDLRRSAAHRSSRIGRNDGRARRRGAVQIESEIASRPLGVSTTRIVTCWPSARCEMPAGPRMEIWTNTSLPPSSLATKPNPLASSNHLTLPVTETAVEGSGATRRGGRGPSRNPSDDGLCGRSTMPAVSTSMHARDLSPLGAGPDLDAQFRARRNGVVARRMQGVGVQERVARAARQLDESVAFVRLEPFDDGVDRRRARVDRPGLSAHRRAAEAAVRAAAVGARRARSRFVGHRPIVIEPALARSKVLTLAHGSPKSPTPKLTNGSTTRPLAVRCLSAKLRCFRLNNLRRSDAQSQSRDPFKGRAPQSASLGLYVAWRMAAPQAAKLSPLV